jgi:oxalyl-CoA decarboxylase
MMSEESTDSTLTDGFHLVVDALKLNGIDTLYGVAGIPVTDLARLAQSEGLRYFGFRHEQSAGFAAAEEAFEVGGVHLVLLPYRWTPPKIS